MTKRKLLIGGGAGLLLLIIIIAAVSGGGGNGDDEETTSVPPTPPPAITAERLYQEREDNATRFDDTYKGNWVRVTGIVGEVDGGEVRLVVDMESYEILEGLFLDYVALEDLPRDAQARANKGETFTATCKVGSFILGSMNLEDCRP